MNSRGPFEFQGGDPELAVKIRLEQTDMSPPPAGYQYGISDQAGDAQIGFNVSANGSRYLRVVPDRTGLDSLIVFDFALRPIKGMGLYLTGMGTVGADPLLIEIDGEAYEVPGQATGGVQFIGFLDEGRSRLARWSCGTRASRRRGETCSPSMTSTSCSRTTTQSLPSRNRPA